MSQAVHLIRRLLRSSIIQKKARPYGVTGRPAIPLWLAWLALSFSLPAVSIPAAAEGLVPRTIQAEYFTYAYCGPNSCCPPGGKVTGGVHTDTKVACLSLLKAKRAHMRCEGVAEGSLPTGIRQDPSPYPWCEMRYDNDTRGESMNQDLKGLCPTNSTDVNGYCQCNTGFQASNSSCVPTDPKNSGPPTPDRPHTCNPINIGTGNKYLAETDYMGNGAFPLQITRVYNSQAQYPSRLGYNWRTDIQSTVTATSYETAQVNEADNRSLKFNLVNNQWTTDADNPEQLTSTRDAAGTISSWTLRAADSTRKVFDWKGRLYSQINLQGLSQTLTYSDGGTGPNGGYVLDAAGNATAMRLPSDLAIRLTDPAGRALHFGYDAALRIAQITDPNGGLYRYTYDSDNNLASVTYPDGKQKQYRYNESALTAGAHLPHALTGIIDENGQRRASYYYDASGRAIQEERAPDLHQGIEQQQLSYTTDSAGKPLKTVVTDPLGTARTYNFKTVLGVYKNTGLAQPGGAGSDAASNGLVYDGNGNTTRRTDFRGNVTTYQYDLARNLEISRTESAGTAQARTITTQWHNTLRLPLVISEPGRITTYSYHNTAGYLLSQSIQDSASGASRTWTYTYTTSADGTLARRLKTVDGPRTDLSDLTTYTYYPNGDLSTVTNALGQVTQFRDYDSDGRPLTLIDANNQSTTLTYTPRGWLASKTQGTDSTTYQYDGVGALIRVDLPEGAYATYSYDAAGRLTDIYDRDNNRIHYTLDAQGNRTEEQILDGTGNLLYTRRSVFDSLSRLQQDVGALNQTTSYTYDSNGNLTGRDGPRSDVSDVSQDTHDALNRLASRTDPLNGLTSFGYDAQGNLAQVKDPRGVTTTYAYNGFGDLLTQTSPDSGTTTYAHDAAGNLTQKTDARGLVTTYRYDALNRLTGRQYPANPALNVQYHYDMTAEGNHGIGRLTAIQDASGVLGYHYDAHGNLVEQLRSVPVQNVDRYDRLAMAYDGANQLTRLEYPNFSVNYPRNAAGQVSAVTLSLGDATPVVLADQLGYLPFGPLKSLTWGNGLTLSRTFDQSYRLTGQQVGSWSSDYAFDANGNITGLDHSLWGSLQYGYDALDRLSLEQKTTEKKTYAYDATGNRRARVTSSLANGVATQTAKQSLTYASGSNRLSLRSSSYALEVDAAGNFTRYSENRRYSYDEQGRLSRATDAAGVLLATYGYNALGQRVLKELPNGTRWTYLYGPDGQLLGQERYSAAGTKLKGQYWVWLDAMPLAGIELTYGSGGVVAASSLYYLHADHLNTPRLASNQNQALIWSWASDAFGVGVANQDVDGDGLATDIPLRFPGQQYDAHTALHYNYFRDYDPQTGRYVESDPIGLDGGINTYAYVGGNPLSSFDYFGLAGMSGTTSTTASAIGSAVGAAAASGGYNGGAAGDGLSDSGGGTGRGGRPSRDEAGSRERDSRSGITGPLATPDPSEMSKGGKQNIDNEYVRDVQAQGKGCDPCKYLRNLYDNEGRAIERQKIKQAMKRFNCDGKNRFN